MTDKSAPDGAADPLELAAIARHGAMTPGWIAPHDRAVLAHHTVLDATSDNPLDGFPISHSGTSLTVTIGSGELFVGGHWGGRDVPTDVPNDRSPTDALPPDDTATIYAGVSHREIDRVIIGTAAKFPDGAHEKLPLYRVTTDSVGVVDVTDLRDHDPYQAATRQETGHIDMKDLGPLETAEQPLYVPDGYTLALWQWGYIPNNQRTDRSLTMELVDETGETIREENTLNSTGTPLERVSGDNFYRIRIRNMTDNATYHVGARFVYSISRD
jgi:hypothetical protein